jgi:hypothetical protein
LKYYSYDISDMVGYKGDWWNGLNMTEMHWAMQG